MQDSCVRLARKARRGRVRGQKFEVFGTSNPELRIAYFPHVVRLRGWRTFSASC